MDRPDWEYGTVLRHPSMDVTVMFLRWIQNNDQMVIVLHDGTSHPWPSGLVTVVGWFTPGDHPSTRGRMLDV